MSSLVTLLPGHSPGQLLFLALAAFVGGLARGFSGFGGGLIFVPLASAAMGPKIAAPVLLIVDFTLTVGMTPAAWRKANRREVFTMLAGALVGTPLGALALARLPSVTLRWIICVVVVCLLALLVSGWRYRGTPRAALTAGVGAVAGLFGGAAQVSGPPIVAYWLGGSAPAPVVRSNLVLYFALASVISFATYLAGGLLTREVALVCLVAGPGYGLGIWIGARMFGLASEATFRRICYLLIALAALLGLPLLDGWR